MLPTIAELLEIELPWAVDGHSALDSTQAERTTKVVVGPYFDAERPFFGDGSRRLLEPSLAACSDLDRKLELFGSGAGADGVFWAGSYAPLFGKNVAELHVAGPAPASFELETPERYRAIEPRADVVPCMISGRTSRPGPAEELAIAVAVAGTVRGATRSVTGANGRLRFSLSVPEDSFRTGANQIEFFVVEGSPDTPTLLRAGPSP